MVVAGVDPGAVSPIPFSYGPPEVWYLLPSSAPTQALDSNGNRVILQIVGKNFGTNLLQVLFSTYTKGAIGLRDRDNNIDNFTYPGTNHTSIRVLIPPYFGKDINVTVIANKQSSAPNGPQFSYLAPIIGNISLSSGRGLQASPPGPYIDNTDWTSNSYGSCLPLLHSNTTGAGNINTVFQVMLDISNGGGEFFVDIHRIIYH